MSYFARMHDVNQEWVLCPNGKLYTELLTFIFAIDEVNKDPELLPNITLGYHIYDTCGDKITYVQKMLNILSGERKDVPNYSCRHRGEVTGFISEDFEPAIMLNVFNHPKISYGTATQRNTDILETYFKVSQNEKFWCMAAVFLVKHFGWNWVGIIVSDEGDRESELFYLTKEMARRGICIEFVVRVYKYTFKESQNIISKSTSKVIILCGQYFFTLLTLLDIEVVHRDRTLILSESWFTHSDIIEFFSQLGILKHYGKISSKNYTDHVDLLKFYLNHTSYYSVYTAVHILAHAIQDMNFHLKRSHNRSRDCDRSRMTNHFVKRINYLDYNAEKISFTEERLLNSQSLRNLVIINGNVMFLDTGSYFTTEDQKFYHPNKIITWKNGRKPQSRCNDQCSPGSRKAPNGRYHVCCYNCVPCSTGEMSNITDSEICHRCPDDGWPDERKVTCVPKTYTFLSYEEDIAIIFIFTSLTLSAVTITILGIFIYHWDSPIVRANNRTVSFILLVSILLSFLFFLFLGRPVDITCMLRQTIFGIFFSISVSSVLSKTLTVCIAFKATKPGSIWRKLIGVKTSTYVLGICSSVQVLICVSWMSVSSPYQEFDMTSYMDQILIQCNEGSDIWFYSMLGYLGFLAAVSFVLAFMVRTLPDSYNEAKYITFSMLVFCSVWIAMIPAYLSTRGKYMVAVEIFAILGSSAGLLGCIFLPKCFIIIKPGTNVKINRKN
ncbi:vomeronasal type-2 receptor 26-like [Dendropsophus ebraccatus]|uniref:vomeronasal type-2 receptor 26-like n=1 Tax=Dendropsophus ebraccatus TaxID=150705 RepID=UPI0038316771